MLIGWKAATETMQAKIDEKDKELEALRGALNEMLFVQKYSGGYGTTLFFMKKHKIIDENSKPTPLLTGIKPDEPKGE